MSRQELEEMYVTLEKPLYNFALRWTWNRALAHDIIQEAFVRVWQRKETLDKRTLKALLYKIVQNLAIDERRKRRFLEAVFIPNWLNESNGRQ
jgi:RNA polymerase sigma factor (sigma-70 family)